MKMLDNMECILFLSEEANFQSRTMLIPKNLFLSVRNDDYMLLKQHAIKQLFIVDNQEHIIDNVLYVYYKQETKTSLTQISSPYLQIVNELTGYACENTIYYDFNTDEREYGYYDVNDEVWYPNAITNLCGGFNHVSNHKYLLKKYPNISESFVVLNVDDPKINIEFT